MINILNIYFDGWEKIVISINWIALIGIAIAFLIVAWIVKRIASKLRQKSMIVNEATLGIGSSTITIKYNRRDQEIAYKLWVELSTRKIGVPYDVENDVIVEIYDSWYAFFSIARELLKEIPPEKLASSNELVELTQKVLNEGLRPHLTKWQAKYRKWYSTVCDAEGTPQEIQRSYIDYDELLKDLLTTNTRMIKYTELLHEIAFKKK